MLKVRKKVIQDTIVPHLSVGSRGPESAVGVWWIVRSILYRLKTGCQWRELSMRALFNKSIHWQTVYYHFEKWERMEVGVKCGLLFWI